MDTGLTYPIKYRKICDCNVRKKLSGVNILARHCIKLFPLIWVNLSGPIQGHTRQDWSLNRTQVTSSSRNHSCVPACAHAHNQLTTVSSEKGAPCLYVEGDSAINQNQSESVGKTAKRKKRREPSGKHTQDKPHIMHHTFLAISI